MKDFDLNFAAGLFFIAVAMVCKILQLVAFALGW